MKFTVIVAAVFLFGGNASTLAQTQHSETDLAQRTKQNKERQSRVLKIGRREEARERARIKWLLEEDLRKAAAKMAEERRRIAEAKRLEEEARQADAARMAEAAKKAEERRRNAEAKRRVTQSAMLPPAVTRILFARASAKLSMSAKSKLEPIVNRMIRQADARLVLYTYAAGDGKAASNVQRLSLARALAVRRRLKARGILGSRIEIQSLGGRAGSELSDRVDLVLVRR